MQDVSTEMTFSDKIGMIRMRFGIRRNKYKVDPGLYAVCALVLSGIGRDIFSFDAALVRGVVALFAAVVI